MKKGFAFIIIALALVLAFLLFLFLTKGTDELDFRSGTRDPMDWNASYGDLRSPAVPDKETALAIAKVILQAMDVNKRQKDCIPSSIYYDEDDEIWVVSFVPSSNQTMTGSYMTGGGFNIAIQKADGKIVKITVGE